MFVTPARLNAPSKLSRSLRMGKANLLTFGVAVCHNRIEGSQTPAGSL
jgi:hypothetical protein